MHQWGDKGVDWKGINDAAYFIGDFCRTWGRMNVRDMKEKYGTVRVYTSLGIRSLLQLTHPGFCHYRPYPGWLTRLDINHGERIFQYTGLSLFFIKVWHPFIYKFAYKRALAKWPHLRKEILACADWPELMPEYYNFEDNDGMLTISVKDEQ